MANHKDLTGTDLHEPKGMSTATGGAPDIGKVVASDGAGASSVRKLDFTELATAAALGQIGVSDGAGLVVSKTPARMGWANYEDTVTTGTPITLTPVDTYVNLTNDGLGAQSDSTFELPDVGAIWNTSTNSFDFSDMSIGDTVDVRVDIEVTTSGANHQIEIQLDMDTAPISVNFQLLVDRENFKSAGTFKIIKYYSLFIGSAAVRDGVHKIQTKSDTGTTDTVKVNGWYVRTVTRSDF